MHEWHKLGAWGIFSWHNCTGGGRRKKGLGKWRTLVYGHIGKSVSLRTK